MELIPKLSRSRTRQKTATDAQAVSHEAIAKAAYYLAEKRGFSPGHDLEDWLEAEHRLNQHSETVAEAG